MWLINGEVLKNTISTHANVSRDKETKTLPIEADSQSLNPEKYLPTYLSIQCVGLHLPTSRQCEGCKPVSITLDASPTWTNI
jgi:hypothetical protein